MNYLLQVFRYLEFLPFMNYYKLLQLVWTKISCWLVLLCLSLYSTSSENEVADILPVFFFSLIIPPGPLFSSPLAQLITPSSHLLGFVIIFHISLRLSEVEQQLSKCCCRALHRALTSFWSLMSFCVSIFSLSYHVPHRSPLFSKLFEASLNASSITQ